MKIVKQIEEQISNYFDPTYNEQLDEIHKQLEIEWELSTSSITDWAVFNFEHNLMWLEEQLVDFPENPFELAEEMIQQEGIV